MIRTIFQAVICTVDRTLLIAFAAPVRIELVCDRFADGPIIGRDFAFAARKIATLLLNGSFELAIGIRSLL